MGKTTGYIAAVDRGIEESQPLIRQRERLFQEQVLTQEQQLLGTAEQVAGFGVDPRVEKYAQRYTINPSVQQALSTGHPWAAGPGGKEWKQVETMADVANQFQQRAQQAAMAGDFVEAERLFQEAQNYITEQAQFGGIMAYGYEAALTLGGAQAGVSARAGLSTPTARAVGGYLERGKRLFEDPNDPELQEMRSQYVDPTFRSTALFRDVGRQSVVGEFQKVQETLETGTQAGAARRLYQKIAREEQLRGTTQAALQEVESRARQEEAQILNEANTFLTKWTRDLSTNAIQVAQNFLASEARDQFHGALDNLAAISQRASDQLATFAERLTDAEEARAAELDRLRGSIAGQALGGASQVLAAYLGRSA